MPGMQERRLFPTYNLKSYLREQVPCQLIGTGLMSQSLLSQTSMRVEGWCKIENVVDKLELMIVAIMSLAVFNFSSIKR